MSIIVTDGKSMVSDTRTTTHEGMIASLTRKIVGHKGSIAGSVGRCGASAMLLDQFERTGEIKTFPDDMEEAILKINNLGEIWLMDSTKFWQRVHAPFYAIGSGYMIALGALGAGATPINAARVVSRFDPNCGGPYHHGTIYGRRDPEHVIVEVE